MSTFNYKHCLSILFHPFIHVYVVTLCSYLAIITNNMKHFFFQVMTTLCSIRFPIVTLPSVYIVSF